MPRALIRPPDGPVGIDAVVLKSALLVADEALVSSRISSSIRLLLDTAVVGVEPSGNPE